MRVRFSLASTLVALGLALGAPASAESPRWGQGYLPNVPLFTQDGQSVRFYDDVLKGKIAIISFIYTSCRDICPLVTARLSQVEDRLGDLVGRDIVFVSISIDPVTDTPAKLKEFADAFGVGGAGWVFLTGKPEDIDLVRYKLGERTQSKTEHRNEVLLFNEPTGEWERASAFGDLTVLTSTIRAMDPTWRNQVAGREQAGSKTASLQRSGVASDAAAAAPIELPGQALFTKACSGCHTIGRGDKVGPDLNGVLTRRDREWVARYITGADKMRSDPIALELAEKFKTVRMPNLGLSDEDASDVMGFLQMRAYAIEADRNSPQAAHQHDQHQHQHDQHQHHHHH